MDEVEITDVNDDWVEPERATEPPKNQDLSLLNHAVADLLSSYGWYLLAVTLLVYLLVQYLSKRRASQAPSRPVPQMHHDADAVVSRQEALEASRRRMQAELDAKAAEFREKQKLLEEEKRRQKIEMWDSMQQGKSYKGGHKLSEPQASEEAAAAASSVPKSKTDKKLRDTGYSPLSGQGGSCSWRPSRRGPSSGG